MQASMSKEMASIHNKVNSMGYQDPTPPQANMSYADTLQRGTMPIPNMQGYVMPQPAPPVQPVAQQIPTPPVQTTFQRNTGPFERRATGGFGGAKRCVWCDAQEHFSYACEELKLAKEHQLVIDIDKKLCDFRTRLPLPVNWGKGGMKKFYEDLSGNNASTSAARLEPVEEEDEKVPRPRPQRNYSIEALVRARDAIM
ncbi:hypothetical protein KP509_06G080600 [Ceratopteris richardii]|uniref:Uncharacterized protein n=2 Tax=Ceratopteris richardii TaxID=49495 RepID=A0A8T2UI95_CERRI|nr:hypothetical protein KP509_06G080600 [Ceratopteris richardii]